MCGGGGGAGGRGESIRGGRDRVIEGLVYTHISLICIAITSATHKQATLQVSSVRSIH